MLDLIDFMWWFGVDDLLEEEEQKMDKKQAAIKKFEDMKNMAELRALSKKSLGEVGVTDREYVRMMELKELVGM